MKNIVFRIFLLITILLCFFVVGALIGSYATRHSSSLSIWLIAQRANLIIGIVTGVITSLGVYWVENNKGKKEFLRITSAEIVILTRNIKRALSNKDEYICDDILLTIAKVRSGIVLYNLFLSKKLTATLTEINKILCESNSLISSINSSTDNIKSLEISVNQLVKLAPNGNEIDKKMQNIKDEKQSIEISTSTLGANLEKIRDLQKNIYEYINRKVSE